METNELQDAKLKSVEGSERNGISNNLNYTDSLLITGESENTFDKDSENANQNGNDGGSTVVKKGQFNIETNRNSVQTDSKIESRCVVKESEAIVKIHRPLCADYKSDSDSDSTESESSASTAKFTSETSSDSESDSTDSEDSSTTKTENDQHKIRTDFSLLDLPPIEDLRISVPEDACIEIGTITSIVDTLVVIESYKGTPALDVDTVLFLDCGKRTLGKVFDILGPVSEPVYAVRFNTQEQIKNSQIEKGLKVYCAPKTQHTSFVFLSEVMKHRGSDASWKDNIEAPAEFQDFSDDEEERRHKVNKNSNGGENGSRKRSFSRSVNVIQPGRFRPQNPHQYPNSQPRPNRFPNNQHRPFMRPNARQTSSQNFQHNVPHYPGNAVPTSGPPLPHMYFTPRFSGPPFPNFSFHNQRMQQPFHQQRTHAFPEGWRPQFVMMPPPPPPPPPPPEPTAPENDQNPSA